MAPARIAFMGQAINLWHTILQEAEKSNKLDDLLAVALSEYGVNQQLQQTIAALRQQTPGADMPGDKTKRQGAEETGSTGVVSGQAATPAPQTSPAQSSARKSTLIG
jgi:hypothetical protein